MHSLVCGQFRMKACCQHTALARGDHTPIGQLRQRLDITAKILQDRRPNKDGSQRFSAKLINFKIDFKAVKLAAKGVAPRRHIHQSKRGLIGAAISNPARHQDRSGARAPERHASAHPRAQRFNQAINRQEFPDCRTLATGDNQAVDAFEMFWQAHLEGWRSNAPQRFLMFAEITLERKDSYCHTRKYYLLAA